jgi:hypothetical protein
MADAPSRSAARARPTKRKAATSCSSGGARRATRIAALADRPVLTVGESAESLTNGAVLELVLVGDRIGFAANLAAAQQAGLKLSSDLLAHAKWVKP